MTTNLSATLFPICHNVPRTSHSTEQLFGLISNKCKQFALSLITRLPFDGRLPRVPCSTWRKCSPLRSHYCHSALDDLMTVYSSTLGVVFFLNHLWNVMLIRFWLKSFYDQFSAHPRRSPVNQTVSSSCDWSLKYLEVVSLQPSLQEIMWTVDDLQNHRQPTAGRVTPERLSAARVAIFNQKSDPSGTKTDI